MSKTITIRLDDQLADMLDEVAKGKRRTKSDVIRTALRRQLSDDLLDLIREELVPRARELGLYTDEDVFRWMKRNPKTGTLACLEPESVSLDSTERRSADAPSGLKAQD
jgi:Arc/MetJ-type ribon-helix-helix transcriptional regulator